MRDRIDIREELKQLSKEKKIPERKEETLVNTCDRLMKITARDEHGI